MAISATSVREGEPVSEINTTPLIDVLLVLLIMLIVTLPPQRHAVKHDTPAPCESCPQPESPPAPVHIEVDYDGALSWNGLPIDVADLNGRLATEARRAPQPEIHIEPHRSARYKHVIHVMASAQREGLTRVGITGGM